MIYLNTDNLGTVPSPERDMPAMIISLVAVKQRDVILSTVKQQQMEHTLSQGKYHHSNAFKWSFTMVSTSWRCIPDLCSKARVNLICNVSWDHHWRATEEIVSSRHSLMAVVPLCGHPRHLPASENTWHVKPPHFLSLWTASLLQNHQGLGIEGAPSYLILHIASGQTECLLQPPLKERGIFRQQLFSCKGIA